MADRAVHESRRELRVGDSLPRRLSGDARAVGDLRTCTQPVRRQHGFACGGDCRCNSRPHRDEPADDDRRTLFVCLVVRGLFGVETARNRTASMVVAGRGDHLDGTRTARQANHARAVSIGLRVFAGKSVGSEEAQIASRLDVGAGKSRVPRAGRLVELTARLDHDSAHARAFCWQADFGNRPCGPEHRILGDAVRHPLTGDVLDDDRCRWQLAVEAAQVVTPGGVPRLFGWPTDGGRDGIELYSTGAAELARRLSFDGRHSRRSVGREAAAAVDSRRSNSGPIPVGRDCRSLFFFDRGPDSGCDGPDSVGRNTARSYGATAWLEDTRRGSRSQTTRLPVTE